MTLAKQANKYLENRQPWKAVKTDRDHAARTLWVALGVINCLKTTLYPYLPFTCQKLHEMLGFTSQLDQEPWVWSSDDLTPGAALQSPQPLFAKLDEAVVEEEVARLGA